MKDIFFTDINLCNKFIEGDDEAYIAMYNLYAKELYAYGLALQIESELIEDTIQDIFTYIYANKQKLINISNPKLYFFTAFRNKLFALKQKSSKKQTIEEDIYSQLREFSHQELWIEQEEKTENELLIKRLLAELNINQREVLYHRFVESMSYEEIGCIMDITTQSAKNLVHRAIKKLRAYV